MKKILKPIIVFVLAQCARLVLRRYKPRIVMVSGSVGKTSTKDAVAAVVAKKFYVRKSEKSFNSEFGVPFTILGVGNPWDDPLAWFTVFKSVIGLLLLPNHYPTMLVLEVGADRPHDLARILRFVTPDALVMTRLADIPVHVEAYASPEQVHEEEFSPAYTLDAGMPLIVPSDDPWVVAAARRVPARVCSYGFSESSDVYIENVEFLSLGDDVAGMRARVSIDEEQFTCQIKDAVGAAQVLPLAAALAVAKVFSIPFDEAQAALMSYETPAGRGRLLEGKNGTVIIDDSYNASPAAMESALATLKSFPRAKRRLAVLGDMLELGRFSVAEHERIAVLAGESADVIVTVGIRARAFVATPKRAEVYQFDTARAAAEALTSLVKEGDVILVKGSQSVRTERIVEALLKHSSDVSKLVRQEKKWRNKP